MKKFLSLFMIIIIAFSSLTACSSGGNSMTETTTVSEVPTTETTAVDPTSIDVMTETSISETKTVETTAESTTNTSVGQVYYLNFKPEADEVWKALARSYTEETGTPVTIVTAASNNYEATLTDEMSKTNAPTLFQINGPVGLANWGNFCYDLKDTKIYDELTSDAYALKKDDEVLGIAYVIESYGIIVNKTLLAEAGYTIDDIKSFADLQSISEDITDRSDELGFAAFTSAGLDPSSDWRFKTHLANLPIYFEYQNEGIEQSPAIKGAYLANYRNIWDLYIHNSTVDPKLLSTKTVEDSRNEFLEKQAVFYQNGSWEYNNLHDGGFSDDELAIIPIYVGVGDEANQGLCTGSENYWCVNKNARPEDIAATLDFMTWCVTSERGTSALANAMGFVIPFKGAVPSPNLFIRQDSEYTREGKIPVSWYFTTVPSEDWKNNLAQALTIYSSDETDGNWANVVSAFVDKWKSEYNLSH